MTTSQGNGYGTQSIGMVSVLVLKVIIANIIRYLDCFQWGKRCLGFE